MLLRKQKKVNLDTFLSQRGINTLNNYHLEENSIFLRRVLNFRRHKKTMSHNFFQSSIDSIPKDKIYKSIKNSFYISSPQSKKKLNYHSKLNSDTVSENSEKNIIFESRNFMNNYKSKNKFYYSLANKSNEDILNRFNRNKNYKMKKLSTNDSKYMDSFSSYNTPDKEIVKNNKKIKKFLYTKKNKNSKFKFTYNNTPTNLSRNNLKYSHTQKNSNSKKNKISNIIDFSIIDKVNKRNNDINGRILSKTSDNFYILNSRTQTKVKSSHLSTEKINKNKALKFFNHFIKYCYTYFILIIKKFFNNIKRIKNEKSKIRNNSNNNCSLFEEFNKDDFDKETIKNKTSDNFFDGLNENSFSFTSEFKKNFVYNRQKRINNQNYQEKNLIQILNMTKMDYTKIINLEKTRNCFDNEQINDNHINNYNGNINNKNEVNHSPFFNSKIQPIKKANENNNLLNNNNANNNYVMGNEELNIYNFKNVELFGDKKKDKTPRNKILIAPENIQCNQINDDILSFRKKNISENIIIKNYNESSSDSKLSIDVKYMSGYFLKNSSVPYNNSDLKINKFYFSLLSNISKIKKITARLKDCKIVKEKEDVIAKGYNNYNNNYLFYNLSTIKEEDERAKNESPFIQTFKKTENYYPISNNSKLYSNTSVEKIIDGDKEIKEDDIDIILMDSLSGCKYNRVKKLKSWQSQEIMVVSNFNSIMRNRINRKENAKLLIKGILCIIRFFSILCFNIRKDTYMQLKKIWKINKFVNHLIIFCFKSNLKKVKILLNE